MAVYRDLAARCEYPLHLGLTEAGMGSKGIVSTTAALGDPAAGRDRRHHPRPASRRSRAGTARSRCAWCRELLQSLGLRRFRPEVTACPGCGRTTSTVFQELAQTIEWHLRAAHGRWRDGASRRGPG